MSKTPEQLRLEIKLKQEELKVLEEQEKKMSILTPVENPDYSMLIKTCEHYIKDISETGYSKDSKHYIYEQAMQAIYGKDCWNWINLNDQGE